MDLGHDTVHALGTVVALVNTGPLEAGRELLCGPAEVLALVQRCRVSDVAEVSEADVLDVRALRERLAAVFRAPDQESAVALVNNVVAEARTTPRLTNHDGWPWHVHYFAPGARLAEHLAADCGMALAFVLAAGERERLRLCAAPGCGRVLADLSRNRSRRYCESRTCGNRLHVAAYRARRSAG